MFRHDTCTDPSDLERCWASNKMGTDRSKSCQCKERVDPDPEGLGLCERHRAEIQAW